jgi:hypothetical protein
MMLVHLDEYLIHYWYMLDTCLEALVSSIVDTWFMDDVAYLYWYIIRCTY